MNKQELINSIDTTYLGIDFGIDKINEITETINKYGIKYFCSYPVKISHYYGDNFAKIGVFNFPHGLDAISVLNKDLTELGWAADEFDIVVPPISINNNKFDEFMFYLPMMRKLLKGKVIKLIVEHHFAGNGYMLRYICNEAIKHNIDYIKTHTGFLPGGVTVEQVKKIKNIVGEEIKIKASGGIKTLAQLIELKEAGAERFGIGIDSAIKIINEVK